MAYSPDGELLTYAGDDGKVTTVATATWEPVQSIPADGTVPPRLLARQGRTVPDGPRGNPGSELRSAEEARGPTRRGWTLTPSASWSSRIPAALARSGRWRTRRTGSS